MQLRITTDGMFYRIEKYSKFRAFFTRKYAWYIINFLDINALYKNAGYGRPTIHTYRNFASFEEASKAIETLMKVNKIKWIPINNPDELKNSNNIKNIILTFCENLAELGCPKDEKDPDMWFRNLDDEQQNKVVRKLIDINKRNDFSA